MAIRHGGNIAQAAAEFGINRADWLDLSTGINPHPYPFSKVGPHVWARLPDGDLLDALICAASQYYKVSDPAHVTPISGTQHLLQVLPHLFENRQNVRIVGPTYKEHENCWRMAGHDVSDVATLQESIETGDIAVVVNPNNPTGALYPPDDLLSAAQAMAQKGGLLIVDGAFVDCAPAFDVSSHIGAQDGLMVLRSFGKFFGLAGIRLGFMLYAGPLLGRIQNSLGPWAVNGPAMVIGAEALGDAEWINTTQARLREASQRIDGLFNGSALTVLGGCDLFRFCQCEDAEYLYKSLAKKGILIRTFDDIPGHVRIGLPGANSEWEKIAQGLNF